jgi:hypothetical protein
VFGEDPTSVRWNRRSSIKVLTMISNLAKISDSTVVPALLYYGRPRTVSKLGYFANVANGCISIWANLFARPELWAPATTSLLYLDAIGRLDGTPCVLEWKTSWAGYPEEPAGIAALDPRLVCYSWMTGIDEVAQVVFVRKRQVEIQYLRATITEEQRQEFTTLVEDTVRQIKSAHFLPHSGIRFPQNPCTTCPFLGLCLDQHDLVEASLVRKPGVSHGLFDELLY